MKLFNRLFKSYPAYEIISDETRIKLYDGRNTENELSWNKVKEIRVFKRDLLTYDCICIAFDLDDNISFEIDEEIKGYKETLELLPKIFKGIEDDWFVDVALPAFETNMRTIWKKD